MGCCLSDFFGCPPQDIFYFPFDLCCLTNFCYCPSLLYHCSSKPNRSTELNSYFMSRDTLMRMKSQSKFLWVYDPSLREYLLENISQCVRSNVTVVEGPVFRWKKRVVGFATLDKISRFCHNPKRGADTCLAVMMFPDRELNRVPIQLTNVNRVRSIFQYYFKGLYCFNDASTEKPINVFAGTPPDVIKLLKQKLELTRKAKYKHIFVKLYEVDVMLYDPSYYKALYEVLTALSQHCQVNMISTTNYLTCKVQKFNERFCGDFLFTHVEMKKRFQKINQNDLDFSEEIRKDIQNYVKNRFEDDKKYIEKKILKCIVINNLTAVIEGPIGNHKKYVAYRAILDKVLKFYRSLKTCSKNQDSFQVVLMFPDKDMAKQHQVEAVSLTSLKVVAEDLLPRDCRGQPKWSWNEITSDKSINIVAGIPQEVEKMVKQKRTFSKFSGVLITDVDVMMTDRHYCKVLKNVNESLQQLTMHSQVILTAQKLTLNSKYIAFNYSGDILGFKMVHMRRYNFDVPSLVGQSQSEDLKDMKDNTERIQQNKCKTRCNR